MGRQILRDRVLDFFSGSVACESQFSEHGSPRHMPSHLAFQPLSLSNTDVQWQEGHCTSLCSSGPTQAIISVNDTQQTYDIEDAPKAFKDFEARKVHKIVFKMSKEEAGKSVEDKVDA